MGKRKKVIAFFRELGFHPDITRFDDRLIAQKVVCLLELKGIDLEYPCGIYVRGPYSPELTRDLYEFSNEFRQGETGTQLDSQEKAAAHQLEHIFGLQPVLLEVGATYGHYTIKERYSPLEAQTRVKRLKPFYSETQVAVGISKAKEFLFEPTTRDLDELKKETSIWQRAALRSLEQ